MTLTWPYRSTAFRVEPYTPDGDALSSMEVAETCRDRERSRDEEKTKPNCQQAAWKTERRMATRSLSTIFGHVLTDDGSDIPRTQ
jgi:hypothetical protein